MNGHSRRGSASVIALFAALLASGTEQLGAQSTALRPVDSLAGALEAFARALPFKDWCATAPKCRRIRVDSIVRVTSLAPIRPHDDPRLGTLPVSVVKALEKSGLGVRVVGWPWSLPRPEDEARLTFAVGSYLPGGAPNEREHRGSVHLMADVYVPSNSWGWTVYATLHRTWRGWVIDTFRTKEG
jgi:hypothetical protein